VVLPLFHCLVSKYLFSSHFFSFLKAKGVLSMGKITLSLLGAGLLAGFLSAQGIPGTGPGVIRGQAISKAFDTKNLTKVGTGVTQVSLVKLPNNAPGTWTACLTIQRLATTYGGTGQVDGVVMGVWDLAKGTFTPNTLGNKLNTGNKGEFGLMLEPKLGLIAVVDKSDGVYLAKRNVFTQAFPAPFKVKGVPGTYVDPSVGTIGGKLKLFYVATFNSVAGIYMSDLVVPKNMSVTNPPSVTGTPVLVAAKVRSSGLVHSPTPMMGPDGDIEGIFMAERVGNDSDMFLANDLNPSTPLLMVADNTAWMNNGGFAGGVLHFANSAHYTSGSDELGVAWLLGDNEKVGGTMNITSGVFRESSAVVMPVFLSLKLLPAALPIGGFLGKLGLDPAVLVTVGTISHVTPDQRGHMAIPLPNLGSLKGLVLPIQGVAFELAKSRKTFTNTAWVKIK
jgi:hypothetical protein